MSLTNKRDIEKIIEDAHPDDGYNTLSVVMSADPEVPPASSSLHIVFRQNGVRAPLPGFSDQESLEVFDAKDPDSILLGEKARLKLLFDALCRFVNTGGRFEQMQQAVDLMQQATAAMPLMIPNFHLMDSAINTDGEYEHVFASVASPYAIRWVEHQFFDVVSLTDLQREQAEAAREQFYDTELGEPFAASDPNESVEGPTCPGEDLQCPPSTGDAAEDAHRDLPDLRGDDQEGT